jgi:hypothetical protein
MNAIHVAVNQIKEIIALEVAVETIHDDKTMKKLIEDIFNHNCKI